MDFFEYMDDIFYSNYFQFIRDVDTRRNEMLSTDKGLLCNSGLVIHIKDEFELSDGRMILEYKDIEFECFFHHKSNNVLYVFLNGALTQDRPQFARWSYYPFLKGSVLNIADPMYQFYDDLQLGWYYGNEKYNLRVYVSEIVQIIADKLGVENSKIIFYGSSGGGAAVIECASHIKGAKAIAINPQVLLAEYSYAKKFEEITHNNLKEDNKWHRNNGIYFLQHNNASKHVIMVNLRCESDMCQINNICQAMGINVKYGINFYNNLIIWLYDCDCDPYIGAHNLQDNYCMFFAINYLFEIVDSQEITDKYSSFYRYINEWWSAWWRQELYWRSRQPNLHYLIECIKIQKKIALFGTGNDAQKLCKELLDLDSENYYGIEAAFDNDRYKTGMLFHGIVVEHPASVKDWSEYFVIISSLKYSAEIEQQLESYGLLYKKDFIKNMDLYK